MLFLDQHSPGDDSANGSWVHLTVNCRKLGAAGGGGRRVGGEGRTVSPTLLTPLVYILPCPPHSRLFHSSHLKLVSLRGSAGNFLSLPCSCFPAQGSIMDRG